MDYNNQTYYDILGVQEDASLNNIQRAKDRLKFGNPDDRVPFSMWAKIDEAYKVLSDSEERKKYDEKLANDRNNSLSFGFNYDDPIPEELSPTESMVEETPEELSPIEPVVEETSEQLSPIEPVVEEMTLKHPPVIDLSGDNMTIENPISTSSNENPSVDKGEEIESENEEEIKEDQVEDEIDDSENDLEQTSERDNDYTTPFTPKDKRETSQDTNLSNIGKRVGGTLAGFVVAGPIGAVAVNVWLSKHKKTKLVKDKKEKKVKKISTEEMKKVEEYNKKLDEMINKELSKPHNNYQLEIYKLKYENQIELLEAILKIKIATTDKKNILKHKLDLVSTKMQLEAAKKRLTEIEEKIEQHNNENKVDKLKEYNEDIMKKNREIEETDINKSAKITKLKIEKKSLLRKRDKKADSIKFRTLRSADVYDTFVKAKDFVRSLSYITKSADDVDLFVNEGLDLGDIGRSR